MKPVIQRILASVFGVPALVSAAIVAWWLVADYLDALRREPIDKQRIAQLEQAARENAEKRVELNTEWNRQKEASFARRTQQQQYGYVVLAAAAVFVACGKWFVTAGGHAAPSLPQIRTHRGDAPATGSPRRRWWRRAKPKRNGQPVSSEIDLSFVDRAVAEHGRSTEAAIPILQRIQTHYRYLPDAALKRVCELTEISPAQIAGVSTFYAQFRRSPVGRHIVKVCHGTACHVAGAREVTDEIRRRLQIAPDADTDPEKLFTVDEVACLGCCSLAPVIMIDETTAGNLTPATAYHPIGRFREEHYG